MISVVKYQINFEKYDISENHRALKPGGCCFPTDSCRENQYLCGHPLSAVYYSTTNIADRKFNICIWKIFVFRWIFPEIIDNLVPYNQIDRLRVKMSNNRHPYSAEDRFGGQYHYTK